MKLFYSALFLTILRVGQAQDTLVFTGPKQRLNTIALLPPKPEIYRLKDDLRESYLQLRACVTNVSSAEEIRFFINGEEQPPERNTKTEPSENPCQKGFYFSRRVYLVKENVFRLEARNMGGATVSYSSYSVPGAVNKP